jgi:superfamily II DNA or RNA helicase
VLTLRPYQDNAIRAVSDEFRAGKRRVVLVGPTGCGKTTILGEMVRAATSRGKRVLVVAHRKELIDQIYDRVTMPDPEGFGVPAGVIMADDPRADPEPLVQVASIQTLARRAAPEAQLVIIDEAHHAVAESYRKLLARYPSAFVVGPTATPFTTSGRGLGMAGFQSILVATTPERLIADGHLVPPRIFADVNPDLRGLRRVGGDYAEDELQPIVMKSIPDVISAWESHAVLSGQPALTLCFAVTVAHSEALVTYARSRGWTAEHVDGTTQKAERNAIFARLRSGTTRLVSNVGIVTEGFDCPAVECVLLARPTQSLGLFLQMVGRGLRPFGGKAHALVIDCGGNTVRLGWPTRDLTADYTLEGVVADPKKPTGPKCRRCERCFAVYAFAGPCPQCGYSKPVKAIDMRTRGRSVRELAPGEVRPPAPMSERRDFWIRIERERILKGYKRGWSFHRWRARFGGYPDAALLAMTAEGRR